MDGKKALLNIGFGLGWPQRAYLSVKSRVAHLSTVIPPPFFKIPDTEIPGVQRARRLPARMGWKSLYRCKS